MGPQQLQEALGKINIGNVAGVLAGLLASLAGVFSNLLLLLFVVAFMALDAVGFSSRLSRVRRERPEVVGALDKFVAGTRSYLLVSTLFGLIVAAIDAGFLWLIGVPLPLLWGLLAFITNYIPNIGFVIGVVPPALLALLQGGPRLMVIVIVVYSVINFIIQSIIQPKYVADAVDLSLTLTFLSLIFWSFVIGPLGAVLAIPLTLLTKALLLDVDPATQMDVQPRHRRSRPTRGRHPAPGHPTGGRGRRELLAATTRSRKPLGKGHSPRRGADHHRRAVRSAHLRSGAGRRRTRHRLVIIQLPVPPRRLGPVPRPA